MRASIPPTFYAAWRDRLLEPGLKDGPDVPPEALLQQIWHHQRLKRGGLTLADGRKVTVLHPGFLNKEAGPDFRNAILRLGEDAPIEGDVEIDLEASGWTQHGHATNPAYAKVILRILWKVPAKANSTHPVLCLAPFLDGGLEELRWWAGQSGQSPESLAGRCASPLASLDPGLLEALLWQAAVVRLRRKASALEALARQHGWTQALWHGLFTALGYKTNTWPMRRLAELTPLLPPAAGGLQTEACLLGMGGFLHRSARAKATPSNPHEKTLWDAWWRERGGLEEHALPQNAWTLSGMRPGNHPERRIALASAWLAQSDFIARLENWLTTTEQGPKALEALLVRLNPSTGGFWSRHQQLRGKGAAADRPMLGESRATDIAVNVLLPWFWSRATAGRNNELTAKIEKLLKHWPAAEDNSVLKQARARLLPGRNHRKTLNTAAAQQGLMQITQDFCNHSNALCENCRFPDLVRTAAGLAQPVETAAALANATGRK